MVDPKFFTFMSVDENGFNQYNHCLIFYERFTETLIREDFDELSYMENLIRKRERFDYKLRNKKEIAGIVVHGHDSTKEVDPDQSTSNFGQKAVERKAAVRMQRAPIKVDHHEQADASIAKQKPSVDDEIKSFRD